MRIALVSQEYPPQRSGGIATQTHAKAHGLAALGHEVFVVTHGHGRSPQETSDAGIRLIRLPGDVDRLPIATEIARWVTHSVRVAETLADIHRQYSLDLIDFPEWGCEGYIHLLNRTSWNAVPTVVHLHGPIVMFAHTMGWPDKDSEFYRQATAMEASCLRMADAVISSSRCSANWCAQHYGVDEGKIPVIHTGIDTDLFQPDPSQTRDRPTILFVGKMVENKGVYQLLAAFQRLAARYPRLRLRMLGDGEPQVIERLRRQAAAAGLAERMELPGRVAPAALPAELAAADIFAAPSIYEGGPGFVYLEAMACGLPVIACRGSGASEAIADGETGYLVGPQDVDELTSVLDRLLQDHDLRAAVGANARRFVQAHAERRTCLAELERLYRAVAMQPAGGVA